MNVGDNVTILKLDIDKDFATATNLPTTNVPGIIRGCYNLKTGCFYLIEIRLKNGITTYVHVKKECLNKKDSIISIW